MTKIRITTLYGVQDAKYSLSEYNIFPPSPRSLLPEKIRAIGDALRVHNHVSFYTRLPKDLNNILFRIIVHVLFRSAFWRHLLFRGICRYLLFRDTPAFPSSKLGDNFVKTLTIKH